MLVAAHECAQDGAMRDKQVSERLCFCGSPNKETTQVEDCVFVDHKRRKQHM